MNSQVLPESEAFRKRWQKTQKGLLSEGSDCAYLYAHFKADTDKLFYVGMGETVGRPWQKRSGKHKNVVDKHGIRIHVEAMPNMSWETAGWWETRWIKAFRDAGYDLVNIADGGDGISSRVGKEIQNRPERRAANSAAQKIAQNRPEVKKKRSASLKKAFSDPETKARVIQAQTAAQRTETALKNRAEANARPEVKAKRSASQNNPETNARRSAKMKQILANRTPEERSLNTLKSWESRRRNQKLKDK